MAALQKRDCTLQRCGLHSGQSGKKNGA